MAALLKPFTFAAALAALFSVPSAVAQVRVAELGDVYKSYNDCFAATPATGLMPGALEERGWQRAKIEKSGRPVESPLLIFGHADRAPLIMLSAESGSGICIVTARVKDLAAIEEFKSAWGDALPKPNTDGTISFFAEGHAIQMAATGSKKEPGIRLVVMTPTETE